MRGKGGVQVVGSAMMHRTSAARVAEPGPEAGCNTLGQRYRRQMSGSCSRMGGDRDRCWTTFAITKRALALSENKKRDAREGASRFGRRADR